MDKVRVGFIGTGRISDLHAIEYVNNPHAQIVALCDRDPALAEARARAWGLDDPYITEDFRELVALDSVDLVEVLLPHHLHLEPPSPRSRPARRSRSRSRCARTSPTPTG